LAAICDQVSGADWGSLGVTWSRPASAPGESVAALFAISIQGIPPDVSYVVITVLCEGVGVCSGAWFRSVSSIGVNVRYGLL
jgi:hypothetical protein